MIKPARWQMKWWFLIDTLLVFISGVQLYVLTAHTDRFFAWTIGSKLTAAFLGAAYWASVPLVFYASRQKVWARARMAVPGVLVFTSLTTVATLLHLDKFNQASPHLSARLVTWVWLLVYISVPIWLVIMGIVQARMAGSDPPRDAPLPGWLRLVLAGQAVLLAATGLVLFVAPTVAWWPWTLTPLTGRAVGAWLLGIAVIAGQAAWENSWERVWGAMVGFMLLGVLQLGALARYGDEVRWGAAAVLYVAVLVIVLAIGIYGSLAGRRRRHSFAVQRA
jgi:hypothetical protein